MARNPDIARTRMLWAANKPGETAAPAYVPDPPAWWRVGIALFAALLLQSSLAPWLALRGAPPSIVTLLVVWYAARGGWLRGLVFGLIAGACEDAFAGATGIAWTFATAGVGALCGGLHRTWLADTKLALVPAAALATFGRFALFACVMQLQGRPIALGAMHVHIALWQSALDAALALAALQWIPNLLGTADAYRR